MESTVRQALTSWRRLAESRAYLTWLAKLGTSRKRRKSPRRNNYSGSIEQEKEIARYLNRNLPR